MTAETKWTKGPWFSAHRERDDGYYATEVFCEEGKTIASVSWYAVETPNGHKTSRSDNAKLIASSPELYEALKRITLYATLVDSDDAKADYDYACAALAKARGDDRR